VRAYLIWEASGRPVGAELTNWLQAEIELATRRTGQASKTAARPGQKAEAQSSDRTVKEKSPAARRNGVRNGLSAR
jgi:hypothetical protein